MVATHGGVPTWVIGVLINIIGSVTINFGALLSLLSPNATPRISVTPNQMNSLHRISSTHKNQGKTS